MSNDDPINWDAVHRSNFERAAFWDVHWIGKAKDLFQSAKKLEPEIVKVWESYRKRATDFASPLAPDHYQGTYFMLLAFCVENLLKAAAVNRNSIEYRSQFRETLKFPASLQDHDLVKLAKLVNLIHTKKEEDLLRRLTRSAIWFGRYPVPLRYVEMSGAKTFNDGREYSLSWFGEDDILRLSDLICSLPMRLGLPEGCWDK